MIQGTYLIEGDLSGACGKGDGRTLGVAEAAVVEGNHVCVHGLVVPPVFPDLFVAGLFPDLFVVCCRILHRIYS